MKKFLSIAALLCSISFASNATAHKAKEVVAAKNLEVSTKIVKLAPVCMLYEVTFDCPSGGWSIQCYGETAKEALAIHKWYTQNAGCY